MVVLQVILYALGAFRLAELFVIDDGPFEMFAYLRGWANRAPFNNGIRRNLANVLTCVHCTGLWVSLALGFVYHFTNESTVVFSILFALAVAGLQSLFSGNFGRGTNV
jgi:hypothetical protein